MKTWNLKCNVDKIIYDVHAYTGKLYTPEMNFPDMSSTIKCFKSIDPEIKCIEVWVGNELDMKYVLGSSWVAINLNG